MLCRGAMEISSLQFWLYLASGLGVPLALFFIVKQAGKKQRAELERQAAMRGWTCEFGPGGGRYLLSGTGHGVRWKLEGRRTTGRSVGGFSTKKGSFTRWSAESEAFPTGLVFIAPSSLEKIPTFGGLGNFLIRHVMASVVGEEADALPDVEPVEAGGTAFREKMAAVASDPAAAEGFLRGRTESLILQWREGRPEWEQPGIVLWNKKLILSFQRCIWDPLLLEAIVGFGTNLVRQRQ